MPPFRLERKGSACIMPSSRTVEMEMLTKRESCVTISKADKARRAGKSRVVCVPHGSTVSGL
jgi:hypothetical protein